MLYSETKRGFSLIEMLIYIAILIVLSSIVVAVVLSLASTFDNMRASRATGAAAISSMERIARDIRNSDSVVSAESTLGAHPGRLTLLRNLSGGGTEKTEFYLNNSVLRVRLDGVDEGALTPPKVTVESLVFTHVTNSNSEGMRIELILKSVKGSAFVTKSFELFVILRESY